MSAAGIPEGLVVVGNGSAGSGDRRTVERLAGRLAAHLPTTLTWTSSPDDLDEVVRTIDDRRRLVVAGGDGSVHALVNAMSRADRLDVPIAVAPLGTGNDLAGGLGITDVDDAVRLAVGDETRSIDLLRCGDLVGVNVVHLGIGAESAAAASRWKPRLGAAAYPLTALATGMRFEPFRATLRLDDGAPESGKFTMIAVANGRRIGGGFPVAPSASVDDGDLEVVLVRETSTLQRAQLALAGRRAEHPELDFVDRRVVRRIRVETDGVGRNVDGEVDEVDVLDVSLEPAALEVCAPAQ